MADLQKTIEIVFGAVDDVSGSVDNINKKISDMSGAIGDATDPLASVHDGVLKLEVALAALAAGGLALAYAKSMEFEAALVELEKVLGEGDLTGLDAARREAFLLSEAYGESATSILSSIADFKQAGFTLQEAMDLTKNSMDLVIAGGVDAAQSSNLLVASLKGFKEPASEAARLVDILNETSNNYATDVEQLAIGMAKLSPIASQFGMSMEETAGVLTPVIEVFRSGDEAATALKTGLLRLIDDSAPVKSALASIGVSQTDANGALRSGKDILFDVSTAFTTLDESQKLFVTQQLVGIQQSARMVEVFDQLGKTSEITATAMDSAGSAAAEVAKRLETAEVQVRIFKESFNNLATAVGDQFALAATEAVKGGSEIVQALRSAVEGGAFDEIFNVLERFFDDMGETFSGVAEALPAALEDVDFSGFSASLQSIRDEVEDVFTAFFGDIDLTTPEGLATAIQKIVNAGTSLNNIVAGIVKGWQNVSEWLGKAADKFGDLDASTANTIGNALQFGKELNILSGILGSASDALGALSNLLNVLAVKHMASMVTGTGGASVAVKGLLSVLSGPAGLVAGLVAAGAAIVNFSLDQMAEDSELARKAIAAQAAEVKKLTDQIAALPLAAGTVEIWTAIETGDLELAQQLINDIVEPDYVAKLRTDADVAEATDYWNLLSTIPEEKRTELLAAINAGDAEAIEAFFAEYDGEVAAATVGVNVNQSELDAAKTELEWFDESGTRHSILVDVEDDQIDQVKKDIENIPNQKLLEIQLQGDIDTQIAQIEAQAETARSAFQYTAEVNIADAQAQADILTAAFEATGQSVEALAGSTADMFGTLAGSMNDLSTLDKWDLQNRLDEQQDQQADILASQIALNEVQAENLRARTEAMSSGDAMIQIDSTGLEPALEMIMWQVIEKVQIRANEESADFLLGLSS